jgi:hypothetical protein
MRVQPAPAHFIVHIRALTAARWRDVEALANAAPAADAGAWRGGCRRSGGGKGGQSERVPAGRSDAARPGMLA